MLRKLGFALLIFVALLGCAFYVVAFYPLRNAHPALELPEGTSYIYNAKIYPSPDAPPIEHGTIVIRDGRIAAIGPDSSVTIPSGAVPIPCTGCVVTAGFWNAHVHFTERKWANAEGASSGRLNAQIADMLTSRGFTTVVDVGSNLRDTIPLRRRIETGNLLGPKIYTAGSAQYPPNGIPYYLRDTLPKWMLHFMPQPATPEEAARVERRNIADGADLLKLFTGSYVERGTVLPMPVENARAAVEVAHAHGQLAFAHPSNLAGVLVAVRSGVDVLAHAPDSPEGIDTALLKNMVDRGMAMVPTLKMFATTVTKNPAYLDPIYAEVRQFHTLGGQLIFGTDVGYMTDYSTADEFAALTKSGLDYKEILAMLTTAPAQRFGVTADKGTLEPGKLADLVLLSADPAADPAAFSQVATTIRSGQVIYQK
jgi:imidazolonepropionase-like amidohydrolase